MRPNLKGELMIDAVGPGSESASLPATTKQRGRRRWQVGMRTLLLAMAAIAVWIAFFINRRQNALLRERIHAMRLIAHELVINDDQKTAVVSLEKMWFDQDRWDIYLPRRDYRLCIATRGIVYQEGTASKLKCEPLKPGRHRIALVQKKNEKDWQVNVMVDDAEFLSVREPREWGDVSRSFGGDQFSISEQAAADERVILFERIFMADDGPAGAVQNPSGPMNGIQLWLEPVSHE
jgi:hypothetical protein